MKLLSACCLLLFFRLISCTVPYAPDLLATDDASRNSVRRAAIRAANWTFVYAAKTAEEEVQLKEMLEEIARAKPLDKQITVLPYQAISSEQLGKQPLLFVGNILPEAVVDATDELTVDGQYQELSVDQAGDLLELYYIRNPWVSADTTIAMHLIYGLNIDSLQQQLYDRVGVRPSWEQLFWGNWDYAVTQGGKPRRKGMFKSNQWIPDPAAQIEFVGNNDPVYADHNWVLYAPDGTPPQADVVWLTEQLEQQKQAVARYFEELPQQACKVYIYPSVERIGLHRQNMEKTQFDAQEKALHIVLRPGQATPFQPHLEYGLLKWFRAVLAVPLAPEEDYIDAGLAVHSNAHFRQRYRNYATALAKRNHLFSADILRNRGNRFELGPYLYDISAAALLDAAWPDTTGLLPTELVASMKSRIQAMKDRDWSATIARRPLTTPAKITTPAGFRKGMTFAHEGYRVYNGYGGSTVGPSLDSLAALGVNTISIVPYSYMRKPNSLGDIPVATFAGGENDQAVAYSAREAHARNWSVMMKPQIWINDAWPGDINFATPDEWDQFFYRYTDWIAHYAILSDLEQVDALCIGTEMVRTTLDHPDAWRKIISLLRDLYGGRLTYAANWGEEFENLSFWDQLDIIGLNSYYPLSEIDTPTDGDLLAGAQTWVAKAEAVAKQFNKPWWLTEVGFRSVKHAWLNPHAGAGNRSASNECQARCFSALVAASADADLLSGMYIWKWPSYLGHGRRRRAPGTGFTPGGKPAAAEIRRFYEGVE
ncbi:MAG: hypothetical protein AAF828_05750 [Bacteroidota bacterium]